MGTKTDFRQESIVICCEAIAETAKQLGLAQYNLEKERYSSYIAQLERINELKARLFNLERSLEALYNELNNEDIVLEDEYYERVNTILHGYVNKT